MEYEDLLKKLKLYDKINTNIIDTTNYKKNEEYFKSIIFSKNNINDSRSWLIHFLGGGALIFHFISENGDLYDKEEIEDEINKLLSWRGTEMNDSWFFERYNKKISRTYYNFIYYSSYLKKIYIFVENILKGILLFNSQGNSPAEKFSLLISFSSIFYIIDKLKNNFFNIENVIKNIKLIGVIHIVQHIIFSIYSTYYFEIEQSYLKDFLNKGITTQNIIEMNKYRDILYEYEIGVSKMVLLTNDIIKNILDKHYFISFISKFLKKKNLKDILLENLNSTSKINLSSFYKDIIETNEIIPLAIFFFNQKGEKKTARECVCSIVYTLQNSNSIIYKKINSSDIIPLYRQKNLSKKARKKTKKKYV